MPKIRDLDAILFCLLWCIFNFSLLTESLLLSSENAQVSLSEKTKQANQNPHAKQNFFLILYPKTIYYVVVVTWPNDRVERESACPIT